jgi:predicted nucleotidyltransferase
MKIDQQQLTDITQRLVNAYQPLRIILFGSQAWGTPNESSDVDLLVVIDHSEEPPWRRAYKGYLSLFGVGIPCDVVIRTADEVIRETAVPASLIHRVVADGRVLYG